MTPDLIPDVLAVLREATAKPLIAKLAVHQPYRELLPRIAGYVDYIACSNTLGPGLALNIHSRKPLLTGITGGISGAAIKPVVMKMVYDLYPLLDHERVGLLAYGGIRTWEDVIEYAQAGAEVFGIGTAFLGKSTKEIVEFTHDLWRGCEKFFDREQCTLQDVIGSAHHV